MTNNKFPNAFQLNDKADAFRHAFWNALMTRHKWIGKNTAKLFSDAHETETPQNQILEKYMDLRNNNVGLYIGALYGDNITEDSLAEVIMGELYYGRLWYLHPVDYGSRTDFDFEDNPNTYKKHDGHHGITSSTRIIRTNK